METLLKDENAPDDCSDSLYRIFTLTYLYGVTPEWRKRPWWLLLQPISGPHTDDSDLYRVTPDDRSVPDGRSYSLYRILTLMAQTYTESLLNGGSAPDGHSYSLYRILTLIAQTYIESLLNGRSTPDGRSYSLYRVLTLIAQTYMESLLNDESAPDGRSYNLYRVPTLTSL